MSWDTERAQKLLAFYWALKPTARRLFRDEIRDELVKAADEGFRDDEVARVKAQLKMGLLTGLESSSARAEQLARQILIHGRPLSTEELIEKVEQVQAADLQALVARMLGSPLSLATVGPILHVARFDRVAEKFTVPSSRAA